jgi:hypothetical protein
LIGDSGGAQKLAVLYRPEVVAVDLTPSTEVNDLIQPWLADVDGDAVLDEYHFTRTPLVVRVTIDATGFE